MKTRKQKRKNGRMEGWKDDVIPTFQYSSMPTFLIGVLFFLISVIGAAQDIHFSQYDFSPLAVNPALTAAYKDLQATLQHKEQWRVVDAYRTSAATFEMRFAQPNWTKVKNATSTFKKGLAAGITLFSDKAGDGSIKQFQANLSIAYHAVLNDKNVFSGGIIGGIAEKSISPDGLRWNSQYTSGVYDPGAPSGEKFSSQSFAYGDFGAGILWSYGDGEKYMTANSQKHINAGVSVMHLNQPPQSYLGTSDGLNVKWTGHLGSFFGIKNTNYSIGPSAIYMQQGKLTELTAGMRIKYKLKENSVYTGFIKSSAFTLGCYYRNRDAVIPFFMYEVDKYAIGISYDTNISGLTAATTGRGGFEISLRFNTPSAFLYQTKASFAQ